MAWSWILACVGVLGTFFVGRKTIWGWVVLFFNECLWMYYAIHTEQYGFRKGSCTYGNCQNTYSRYKYSSGDVYEGEFSKGYLNGWGTLLHADNSFYIGNFSNGYKHGWGIVYLPKKGNFYKTYFNYGTVKSMDNYQGFSGTEEDIKLDALINVLQEIIPGKTIDIKSEDYQEFIESLKPEDEPVPVKID